MEDTGIETYREFKRTISGEEEWREIIIIIIQSIYNDEKKNVLALLAYYPRKYKNATEMYPADEIRRRVYSSVYLNRVGRYSFFFPFLLSVSEHLQKYLITRSFYDGTSVRRYGYGFIKYTVLFIVTRSNYSCYKSFPRANPSRWLDICFVPLSPTTLYFAHAIIEFRSFPARPSLHAANCLYFPLAFAHEVMYAVTFQTPSIQYNTFYGEIVSN